MVTWCKLVLVGVEQPANVSVVEEADLLPEG